MQNHIESPPQPPAEKASLPAVCRPSERHESHPAANIFPMMDDVSFNQLVDDIKTHGQREPIVLLDQQVIDGRNRYKACQQLGIQPDFCELEECTDPLAYVLSANLHRRHLSKTQLALVAAKARSFYDDQAKERQKRKPQESVPEKLPEQKKGDARDQAGDAVGVSGKYVDMATKVIDKGSSELQSAVDSGEIPLKRAAKVAELPKCEQAKAVKEPEKVNNSGANDSKAKPATAKNTGAPAKEDAAATNQQRLDHLFAEFESLSPHSKHAFHKRLLRDETIRKEGQGNKSSRQSNTPRALGWFPDWHQKRRRRVDPDLRRERRL